MSDEPAFFVRPDREADVFDTPQQASQPATTTGDPLGTLADWKGERSRRAPGDASTAGPEGTEERSEQRGRPSGDRVLGERQRRGPRGRPAGGRGTSERQAVRGRRSGDRALGERQRCESRAASREPRTHESARASEVPSALESTSGTEQFTAYQPILHQ